MSITIKAFPANDGDCFIIKYGESEKIYNVMVDGGRATKDTLRKLKVELDHIKELNQCIDLLIVTHIDLDHIDGVLKIFQLDINKNLIKSVWFNSGRNIAKHFETNVSAERDVPIIISDDTKIGVKQGESLEKELEKLKLMTDGVIMQGDQYILGDAVFNILSPNINNLRDLNKIWEVELEKEDELKVSGVTKTNDHKLSVKVLSNQGFVEDQSLANASSIAFLMEYKSKKILMLGDAVPTVIVEGLKKLNYCEKNKLSLDLMKISHHGSRKNTSGTLMELISCNRYIISTNGGKLKRLLPDKESLSRILNSNRSARTIFYFNYPIFKQIFSEEEIGHYDIVCKDLSQSHIDYMIEV